MKSEAQPLRITADTEPAEPRFIGWGLCHSAQAVHIGDGCFEIRDAEEHEEAPVRIASMDASLE